MATKTFKIGLSNTDKQNMAQDIYERLLALTFPEYDSAESYDVGDFVVYNDQLYKCIGETSGAWDSSKWQLATLNDLLTDIEYAVQFVNDKANVDGNYPTMTVGVADQLSPYDDESGDDQDEPFSFQATGTGNGSQPDFATGSIALMKEKRGNTVVVNQLVTSLVSTKTVSGVTFTNNGDGSMTISGTATADIGDSQATGEYLTEMVSLIRNNHYFYIGVNLFTPITGFTFGIQGYSLLNTKDFIGQFSGSTAWTNRLNCVIKNGTAINIKIRPMVIDLTQWFNGDIPQDLLDHPENFFRYYQGDLSYNEGELINSNSRYLKAIGRNQWDEETELGTFNSTTGEAVDANNRIRSKNYIRVIPNATYYFYGYSSQYTDCVWYDANKNIVKPDYILGGTTFTVPSNACYMRFSLHPNYGTTYNNDITISLYYTGESGYDQYYPYELLTNNDTGSEELLAFDYKTPDGTIHHNTKKITVTTTVSGYNRPNGDYLGTIATDGYKGSNSVVQKIISSIGIRTSADAQYSDIQGLDVSFAIAGDGYVYICVKGIQSQGDLNTWLATNQPVVEYELSDESKTTEQGTPYSENIVIDDFGSMDFSGTSGVPQGNLIFYPVDYKAFIDTLYNQTDGTPSKILTTETSQSNLDTYLNSKGYYKIQDFTSQVTDIILDTRYLKVFKCNKIVTISLDMTNQSGSDIVADTPLFKLPASITTSSSVGLMALIDGEPSWLEISNSGAELADTLPDNAVLLVSGSFIID